MKIKGITKSSVKYFCAAMILTAVFIAFAAALIIAEKNTSEVGFEKISTPLSFKVSGGSAVLTVNDRQHSISLLPIIRVCGSKAMHAVAVFFLLL